LHLRENPSHWEKGHDTLRLLRQSKGNKFVDNEIHYLPLILPTNYAVGTRCYLILPALSKHAVVCVRTADGWILFARKLGFPPNQQRNRPGGDGSWTNAVAVDETGAPLMFGNVYITRAKSHSRGRNLPYYQNINDQPQPDVPQLVADLAERLRASYFVQQEAKEAKEAAELLALSPGTFAITLSLLSKPVGTRLRLTLDTCSLVWLTPEPQFHHQWLESQENEHTTHWRELRHQRALALTC